MTYALHFLGELSLLFIMFTFFLDFSEWLLVPGKWLLVSPKFTGPGAKSGIYCLLVLARLRQGLPLMHMSIVSRPVTISRFYRDRDLLFARSRSQPFAIITIFFENCQNPQTISYLLLNWAIDFRNTQPDTRRWVMSAYLPSYLDPPLASSVILVNVVYFANNKLTMYTFRAKIQLIILCRHSMTHLR